MNKQHIDRTADVHSPGVIRNSQRGRHGAMDIWSMGCRGVRMRDWKKPWTNLDNEWCGKSSLFSLFSLWKKDRIGSRQRDSHQMFHIASQPNTLR